MIINFQLSETQYEQASRQVSALLSEKSQISNSILKFPIKLAILAAMFGLPLLFGVLASIVQGLDSILLALNINTSNVTPLDFIIAIGGLTLPLLFIYVAFQSKDESSQAPNAEEKATPPYTLANVSINNNRIERASLDLDNSPITITFRSGEKWEVPVESIYRYTENDSFFIFLADNNKALCIPKEALGNSIDLQDFRKKVEELLPYVVT